MPKMHSRDTTMLLNSLRAKMLYIFWLSEISIGLEVVDLENVGIWN